jgi:hypothetical protein
MYLHAQQGKYENEEEEKEQEGEDGGDGVHQRHHQVPQARPVPAHHKTSWFFPQKTIFASLDFPFDFSQCV